MLGRGVEGAGDGRLGGMKPPPPPAAAVSPSPILLPVVVEAIVWLLCEVGGG